MKSGIEEYVTRPKRYDNIDGTAEMGLGIMMLAFALYAHLQPIVPKSSTFGHGFGGFAFMYVILLPVLGLGYWGIKAIKRRITYARTGYVAYRRDLSVLALLRAIALSAGLAAALFLILNLLQNGTMDGVLRLIAGALFMVTYALFARLSREHTWK